MKRHLLTQLPLIAKTPRAKADLLPPPPPAVTPPSLPPSASLLSQSHLLTLSSNPFLILFTPQLTLHTSHQDSLAGLSLS